APAIETDLTGKAGTKDPITVTGAEPGSTVKLKDKSGNVIGTGIAGDNGTVTITPDSPIPAGDVTATATDKANNESEPSTPKPATEKVDTPTKDTTPPSAPTVTANNDGTVTVTPPTEPDTKTVDITYTPEGSDQPTTVTATKDDTGNWTVPDSSGLQITPDGVVTIPADKVKDGTPVTAKAKDNAPTPNVSDGSTETTKPASVTDTTPPAKPTVTANNDGTVTVTPPTEPDTKTVDITYTPEGSDQPTTVTATKGDDGNWTVPQGSDVQITPEGVVTIPADKVKDGTPVTAKAKDNAPTPNVSDGSTETAKPASVTDTTPPAKPAIATDLTGKAGTTDPIKVTGAEPGTTVTLKGKEGNVIGTGTANDKGEVEITPTAPLPAGPVTATATDKAGNESAPSEEKVVTTPDKTAPEAPAVKANEDGSVTVTPSTTAGDDTKTVEITYTDETGTEKTVPVTKGEDG
ncbi:TPA: Ig-like domain-containing protein, partial [Streptococcus suis]